MSEKTPGAGDNTTEDTIYVGADEMEGTSRLVLWIALAVATVGILVGVVLLTGNSAGTATETTTDVSILPVEETGTPLVFGDPLPQMDPNDPENDPAVGMAAPLVEGVSFDRDAISIPIQNKITVLLFLAHWCPHCQDELDDMTTYLTTEKLSNEIAVLVVSTGVDETLANSPPSEWFATSGFPNPVVLDSDNMDIAAVYALPAFPFIVVIDTNGIVAARIVGGVPADVLFEYAETLVP